MRTEHKAITATNRGMKLAMGCLLSGPMVVGAGLVQQARAAQDEKPTELVSLSQLNSEFQALRENLSRTMAAPADVKTAAGNKTDLAQPYANCNLAYIELVAQVANVRPHGTAAKTRAKEHWEAWQKELIEVQNPKPREKAQNRYPAASGKFEKITQMVDAATEGFAQLAANLKDIDTYLKTDLTKDAASSLSNRILKLGGTALPQA